MTALPTRFLMPGRQRILQRLTFLRQTKVDDRRRSTERRRFGTRCKIIRRDRSAKRHVEVCVRVNSAWEHESSGCINHFRSLGR